MKKSFIDILSYCVNEQFYYTNIENNKNEGSIKVFEKSTHEYKEIIELFDGDNLSLAELKKLILDNEVTHLDDNGNLHILRIFIFINVKDDKLKEMERIIRRNGFEQDVSTYSILLNLSTGKIYKFLKGTDIFYNIEQAIESILKEELINKIEEFGPHRTFSDNVPVIEYIVNEPYVTYILLIINILIFSFLNIYDLLGSQDYYSLLLHFGAKVNFKIIDGEYWRLITPMFLHSDIRHLLFNSLSLVFLGSIVERIFGYYKFLIIYFAAGIYGNIFSFFFSDYDSVGASGAIFGLLGSLIFYGLCKQDFFKTAIGANVIFVLIFNLLYGLLNPVIDNYAHIGGLISGYLTTGIIMGETDEDKIYLSREFSIISFITVTILCIFVG